MFFVSRLFKINFFKQKDRSGIQLKDDPKCCHMVLTFFLIPTLCIQRLEVLVRLGRYLGSSEPLLIAHTISKKHVMAHF